MIAGMFNAGRARLAERVASEFAENDDFGFSLGSWLGRESPYSEAQTYSGQGSFLSNISPTQELTATASIDPLTMTSACGCGCGRITWAQTDMDKATAKAMVATLVMPAAKDDDALATGLLDQHADDFSTTATINVDGAHIVASIDAIGDQDFFQVTLTAGETIEIGQYLYVAGPTGVPLSDAYLELYDSNMVLVASADGDGPNTPSGLDALLTYTPTTSGTYYINARAFDQDPINGTTGDAIGDYELFVDTTGPTAPGAVTPRYSLDSPLHSIDWGGNVIDRTSRNPDGDNGTRPNAAAPDGGGMLNNNEFGITGKNVVTYYFAKQGDVFIDEGVAGLGTMAQAQNMEEWEKQGFRDALAQFEKVADVIYIEVQTRNEADFKFITYEGTPGAGGSVLGRMSPPNEANEGQSEINEGDVRWTEAGVKQGGFYFQTLVHELGHGHGLAHPHDTGGGSSVMRGAGGSTTDPVGGAYGDFGLSQQVYTIMSYNAGWDDTPAEGGYPTGHGGPSASGLPGGTVHNYGWMGTLGALDIAVIQDKYGVNEEYATGNDLYTIKDFSGTGNFYQTIWDAGGTDEINYIGARNTVIDLRAATLQYEEGGGGRMSFAYQAWGGFTIANGVVIENATGGKGADTLIGNDVANLLKGSAGDDILIGGAGGDALQGGAGIDTVDYSSSSAGVRARLYALAGNGGDAEGDVYSSIENAVGSAFADELAGTSVANILQGGAGDDLLNGRAGADVLIGGEGSDTVTYFMSTAGVTIRLNGGANEFGEAAGDRFDSIENVIGSNYTDALVGNSGANRLEGGAAADYLNGGGGADVMVGGSGGDVLIGGTGDDILTGGTGADKFTFSGLSGADVVTDFQAGALVSDILRLDGSVFLSVADVLAHTTDDGSGNTIIAKDGVQITLNGVSKAQLHSNDFEILSAAMVQEENSKEAALVLPGLVEDDPLVLPGGEGKVFEPDDLGPQILPVGLESKQVADADPIICPGDDAMLARPFIDLAELGLSNFDGRDPHRILLEPRGLDWIV